MIKNLYRVPKRQWQAWNSAWSAATEVDNLIVC